MWPFCLRSVKFTVLTVEVRVLFFFVFFCFFTYCKFLILAYDDRKLRTFRGTGCQS